MKQCSKCKQSKPLTEFSKDKTKCTGYRSECKSCVKEYYQNNKEKIKEHRQKNQEKIKEYYQANKDKIKEHQKEYQKNNRHIQNQYIKERKAIDPLYKLTRDMRSLIAISIKNNGYTKRSKTYEILGCSYEQFKAHIEQQFTEGMNWDNHGKWHYDHIKPISHGKTEKEILALNHYLNFQPLWARDNLSKGNNIHWQKCTEKYK